MFTLLMLPLAPYEARWPHPLPWFIGHLRHPLSQETTFPTLVVLHLRKLWQSSGKTFLSRKQILAQGQDFGQGRQERRAKVRRAPHSRKVQRCDSTDEPGHYTDEADHWISSPETPLHPPDQGKVNDLLLCNTSNLRLRSAQVFSCSILKQSCANRSLTRGWSSKACGLVGQRGPNGLAFASR